MKNIFAALILSMAFVMPAFAQNQQNPSAELNAEIAQMNDAQKAEALAQIRAGRSSTAEAAKDWVDIGNALGEGLAATAEKLGIVANDFANSPLGKLAIVLILWNYMGESVLLIVAGFTLLVGGTLVWLYQMRKIFGKYSPEGKFIQYDADLISNDGSTLACFSVLCELIVLITAVIIIVNAV